MTPEKLKAELERFCDSQRRHGSLYPRPGLVEAANAEIDRLRRGLAESQVMLEALNIAVEWELAPAIKQEIARLVVANRCLLFSPAPVPTEDRR